MDGPTKAAEWWANQLHKNAGKYWKDNIDQFEERLDQDLRRQLTAGPVLLSCDYAPDATLHRIIGTKALIPFLPVNTRMTVTSTSVEVRIDGKIQPL